MEYKKLLSKELEKKLKEKSSIIVPFGLLQQHNSHLPLGTDGIKAYEICKKAADRTGSICFPIVWIGVSGNPKKEGRGTIYFSEDVFKKVVVELFEQLIKQGFKNIVAFSGHHPKNQIEILRNLGRNIAKKHKVNIRVFIEDDFAEVTGYVGDRGDKWESSLFIALCPDLVKTKRASIALQKEISKVPREKIKKVILRNFCRMLRKLK